MVGLFLFHSLHHFIYFTISLIYRTQFHRICPAGLSEGHTKRINENIARIQLTLSNECLFDTFYRLVDG